MSSLYEAIGASPGDSDAKVKAAYRRAARKSHPDAGGSREEFKAVGYAGMILCDPEKRAHYDRTGEELGLKNEVERRIASMLGKAFGQDMVDPIRSMCEYIDKVRSEQRGATRKFEQSKKKLSIKLKKFVQADATSSNTEARDFIAGVLENHIGDMDRAIAAAQSEAEICEAMLAYLNDLKCPASVDGSAASVYSAKVVFGSVRTSSGWST